MMFEGKLKSCTAVSQYLQRFLFSVVSVYYQGLKRQDIHHKHNAVWWAVTSPSLHPRTYGLCRIYNKYVRLEPCVKLQGLLHGLRCLPVVSGTNPSVRSDTERAFSFASVSYFLLKHHR